MSNIETIFKARILTLFPDMFPGFLGDSLAGRALEKGIWDIETVNIRDFATDNHKTVDDTPSGGGAGMVMRADIVDKAISSGKNGRLLMMSPRGRQFNQAFAEELALEGLVTFLCGRYEGIDQRVLDAHDIEEVSMGDFVLSGGEPAAMIMLDAIIRLLPNVMGNKSTIDEESFSDNPDGLLLEYPHYTRPAIWVDNNGVERLIPEVLSSGHHGKIAEWRRTEAEKITKLRRPDLWRKYKKSY